MYRGFNLSIQESDFADYSAYGNPIHSGQKRNVETVLNSFTDSSGNLLASRILANWFPQIDCEVFISHAHKDSELAIRLSGLLHKLFGLNCFIDSCIWGYSNDLLRLLDDQYCWNPGCESYNYEKRNRSTTHVHMMLSTALSKMMDKCECIIFLNTPHSISSEKFINAHTTDSPWIYSEIAMTSLIEKKSRDDHRLVVKADSIGMDEALKIKYDISLTHLTPLTTSDLYIWIGEGLGKKGFAALDTLYNIK